MTVLPLCSTVIVRAVGSTDLISTSTVVAWAKAVDAANTMVMEGNMVKVISWYDNESGFSQRVIDLLKLIGR